MLLTRGEVGTRSTANGRLAVAPARTACSARTSSLDADLVVLATGMVPNSADGEAIRDLRRRPAARPRRARRDKPSARRRRSWSSSSAHHEGTEILNLGYRQGPDLPVLRYGFPDSHFICFPYETRRTGIYAAGALRAPMDAAQAAEDGWGAAMKAVQCIARRRARRGGAPARRRHRRCPTSSCSAAPSASAAPRSARSAPSTRTTRARPQLNPLRCRRCGICMGACPERIINFPDYSVDAVAAMIKAIEVPEEYEEKPRILALLCENDALPALDAAAAAAQAVEPLGPDHPGALPRLRQHRLDRRRAVRGHRRRDPDRLQVRRRLPVPLRPRLGARQHPARQRAGDAGAAGAGARADQGRRAGPRRVRPHSRRSSTSSPRSSRKWDPTRYKGF